MLVTGREEKSLALLKNDWAVQTDSAENEPSQFIRTCLWMESEWCVILIALSCCIHQILVSRSRTLCEMCLQHAEPKHYF